MEFVRAAKRAASFLDAGSGLPQKDAQDERVLGAILANEPTGKGAPTQRHVRVAATLLDCEHVEIANLFPIATPSFREISAVGGDWSTWLPARIRIAEVVASSDEILLAWGVAGIHGEARKHLNRQVEWVTQLLEESGKFEYWTVGGNPRHPSRWHQFVSDRYGRTPKGTFPERLQHVLVKSNVLYPPGNPNP